MIPITELTDTAKDINWDLNFGELVDDVDFVSKCNNLVDHLKKVQQIADELLIMKANYEQLPPNQQIELDLFFMYILNSLWWINLRLKGVNMTNHPIKREFQRIKAAMVRWKEVKERKLRPTVNIEVAQRFVRSGLYDHTNRSDGTPPNKKIRFNDSDE